MPSPSGRLEEFAAQGFAGPVPVLSGEECARALAELQAPGQPAPADWPKGGAVTSRAFYRLATQPALVDAVAELLGGRVMLWGASLLVRPPGAVHPWHSDIESCAPDGRTVSAWIGLAHTSRLTALKFVPGSHRFGLPIQQVAAGCGLRRAQIRDEDVLDWSRQRMPGAAIHTLDLKDGEALLFDGRLWHGSHNLDDVNTRVAVLLQYAVPETPIRIPDLTQLEWPFRQLPEPRPPCLLLRGEAAGDENRFALPLPMDAGKPPVRSGVCAAPASLSPRADTGWRPHSFFHGATPGLDVFSCHTSALAPGRCPHPPHRHDEEEILILLDGELELCLPDGLPDGRRSVRLEPGGLVYYPSRFAHTHRSVGAHPARYTMFKWRGAWTGRTAPLAAGVFPAGAVSAGAGWRTTLLFEGATDFLRLLHVHVSELAPGAGYAPHRDAHHVALVPLHGRVELLGGTAGPMDVVFCAAGDAHGMRNAGAGPARYFAIEFHESGSVTAQAPRREGLLGRLSDRLRGIVAS